MKNPRLFPVSPSASLSSHSTPHSQPGGIMLIPDPKSLLLLSPFPCLSMYNPVTRSSCPPTTTHTNLDIRNEGMFISGSKRSL